MLRAPTQGNTQYKCGHSGCFVCLFVCCCCFLPTIVPSVGFNFVQGLITCLALIRSQTEVAWSPLHWPLNLLTSLGLTSKPFYGLANTQEVECSGRTLDSATSLLSLSLFSLHDDRVLASANIATKACLTSGYFSSCLFHQSDTRQSKLRTVVGVQDLADGEEKWIGCNVTAFVSGGRSMIYSWKLAVSRSRK